SLRHFQLTLLARPQQRSGPVLTIPITVAAGQLRSLDGGHCTDLLVPRVDERPHFGPGQQHADYSRVTTVRSPMEGSPNVLSDTRPSAFANSFKKRNQRTNTRKRRKQNRNGH